MRLFFSHYSHLLQEWLYMHYQEWRLESTMWSHQIRQVPKKKMATLVTQRARCQHSLMGPTPSVLYA